MKEVTVHEVETQLSGLLDRVASGEQFVIPDAGKSIARLVPFDAPITRHLGRDIGVFTVPEGFDQPWPEDVLYSMIGRPH
jgi:antitoxin (DNA-binding transcriptional repressor) of toxin-antitoxin stability system